MVITGKRHDFEVDYLVGHDADGKILAVDMQLAARCGWAADLSGPVTDRALFHADNCYHYPAVHLTSRPYRTNTQSNTAFRGFGGPQGMVDDFINRKHGRAELEALVAELQSRRHEG